MLVTLLKLLPKPFSKIATIPFPFCEALAFTRGQLNGVNHFHTPLFRLAPHQTRLFVDQYNLHMLSMTIRKRRVLR